MSALITSQSYNDNANITHTIGVGNFILESMYIDVVAIQTPAAGQIVLNYSLFGTSTGTIFIGSVVFVVGAAGLFGHDATPQWSVNWPSGFVMRRADTLNFSVSTFVNISAALTTLNIYGKAVP